MSIKKRVTLFYAGVLILITLFISIFFLLALRLENNNISQTTLETTVKESFDKIYSEADWLEVSSDFDFYVNDVSLVLYGPEGTLLMGNTPNGFPQSLPLLTDEHQRSETQSETWQVYDFYKEYPNGTGIWVRGIYSLQNSMAFQRCPSDYAHWITHRPSILYLFGLSGYPARVLSDCPYSKDSGGDRCKPRSFQEDRTQRQYKRRTVQPQPDHRLHV